MHDYKVHDYKVHDYKVHVVQLFSSVHLQALYCRSCMPPPARLIVLTEGGLAMSYGI
jgi:hypothetical protein